MYVQSIVHYLYIYVNSHVFATYKQASIFQDAAFVQKSDCYISLVIRKVFPYQNKPKILEHF